MLGRGKIEMIDPVAGVGLFNAVSGALKTISELRKTIGNKDAEQKLAAIYDSLWDLRDKSRELEDENRKLRDQLRFNSDEYEFRNPYRYHKSKPNEPLCVKCFANNVIAQMSERRGRASDGFFRKCLVCASITAEGEGTGEDDEPSFALAMQKHGFTRTGDQISLRRYWITQTTTAKI